MSEDVYQPIRDYAQAQLLNFDSREDYIAHVVAFWRFNGPEGDDGHMMAHRIARHAWDSTPHKVIPHAHLSPDQIPPGAKSPEPYYPDHERPLAMARRLQAESGAEHGGAGQPAPGLPKSGQGS